MATEVQPDMLVSNSSQEFSTFFGVPLPLEFVIIGGDIEISNKVADLNEQNDKHSE